MIKLYLDIDGVILRTNDKGNYELVPKAKEFLIYIRHHYDCYWLTTHGRHGKGDVKKYLSQYFSACDLGLIDHIKCISWKTLKTEAIDFSSDFIWIDDTPLEAEIAILKKKNRLDNLIIVDNLAALLRQLKKFENKKKVNSSKKTNEVENSEEIITKMQKKYIRTIDELNAAISDASKSRSDRKETVIVSDTLEKNLGQNIDKLKYRSISVVSTFKPYTHHLKEKDTPRLALKRYMLLQNEKKNMVEALMSKNRYEVKKRGLSAKEIEEQFYTIIYDKNVNVWNENFTEWIKLEYKKIKTLVKADPIPENIKVLEELLFSDEIEFHDEMDLMECLLTLPHHLWESMILDILEEKKFEEVWKRDYLFITEYWQKFKDKNRLNEIFSVWEAQLSKWIKSGEIKDHFSEKQLFNELMGFSPERLLKDLQTILKKMSN